MEAAAALSEVPMPARHRRLGDGAAATVFLAPATLLAGVFMLYPILDTIAMSLFRVDQFGRFKAFRGLANYTDLAADPKFVDAQVANYQASIGKADPEVRTLAAFGRFVEDTIGYFQSDPVIVKELRLFARDGQWEVDDMLATATLKGSPRKVFFKQIGDRWYLENRQQ